TKYVLTQLRNQPNGYNYSNVYGPDYNETSSPVRRRVSIVIFLNAGDYEGGALTFYGLVDDPSWKTFGFALEATPGLLVAFPSHVRHEVTPVTAGDRYTVVDWFTA